MRIVLFLLVWASCAWFGSWELNPNTATRLFATLSIVEDGDAVIDEWDPLTIDKARFDGHLYLDKAPGMTVLAIPAVAAAAAWSPNRSHAFAKDFGDAGLARFLRARVRLAAATGPALLTALAAVLLFDLALAVTGSAGGALVAALGYGLGTPAWGWSTTLTGHAPVAALFVVALWAAWRGGRDAARRYPLVVGGALGAAALIEHQAVIAGAAIAAWALLRVWGAAWRWRFVALAIAAGIAALAVPLLGYNLFAFGTPFRLGYQGVVGFEGMERGLFGLGGPDVRVVWAILFGTYRGLLWLSPVLILAALGLERVAAGRDGHGLAWCVAGVAAAALLVNAAYYYWDGGNSTGPRHALPLVGVVSLGLAGWWAGAGVFGRVVAVAALALSIAINAAVASAEVFAPPLYDDALRGSVWPLFARGELRTVASEWWGWSPPHGFALWAVSSALAIGWLVAAVRRGCAGSP